MVTAGVVTPNIEATTIGFSSPSGGTVARAIPASAPAAFAMIRADTRFTPAMSTTEYIIVTSTEPTYGLVSPEATVETISFGTPIGNSRIAWVTSAEPPDPPRPPIASRRPSAWSRFTISAAPRAIVSTAAPRSPARASSPTSAPAAAATSSRGTSGEASGSPTIPASTRTTSTPCSRIRSARYAYSRPFVSSVPTRTTVGISSPPCPPPAKGSTPGWSRCLPGRSAAARRLPASSRRSRRRARRRSRFHPGTTPARTHR